MTQRIDTIYCDVDGVLCQLVEAVVATVQRDDLTKVLARWPKGCYELAPAVGVSNGEVWRQIDALPATWWTALPPYEWAKRFVITLEALVDQVILVTKPRPCAASADGKRRWLRYHFFYLPYLFMDGRRHALARPGALLVDDCQAHVQAFRRDGGQAIVFPRPWNLGRPDGPSAADVTLESVRQKVEE